MKTTIRNAIGGLALLSAIVLTLQPISLRAQGTAFTYQGRLDESGQPANGLYDFRAQVYNRATPGEPGDTLVSSTLTFAAVPVTNGLFTLTLDFGGGPFNGEGRWLMLQVRTNNALNYTLLLPRQPVSPTPYAILAGNVSGVIANSSLPANPSFSGTVSGGSFTGSGAGLTGLNASQLTSGTVPDARLEANVARTNQVWLLGGNAGTTPSTHFLGTTDNQPLEVRVNNQRAWRLEPTGGNTVNVVGGYVGNYVSNTVVGATIGGGGAGYWFGNAYTNRVLGNFGTVAGGLGNTVSGNYAAVGGGRANTASFQAATVGGGLFNTASGNSATVGGGWGNTASGTVATVGGGENNSADGSHATIPGGKDNRASGAYSFAAGRRANAVHEGTFVWADSQDEDFASTGNNQFVIRAAGGVGIGTRDPQASLHVYSPNNPTVVRVQSAGQPGFGRLEFVSDPQGDANQWRPGYIQSTDNGGFKGGLAFVVNGSGPGNKFGEVETMRVVDGRVGIGTTTPVTMLQVGFATCNGSTWNNASDRDAKENFQPVDVGEVLEKVAAMPLSRWRYKAAPDVEHLGPVAQDFHTAFGLGEDDKHIATVDADGVALAAIQGLNRKVESGARRTEADLAELRRQNAALRTELAELKQLIRTLAARESGDAR